MRAFAWVRVQRAELARSLGDLDRAARLLADAERAYPGWWYVTAHTAALDAAAGRPDRAVTGYRSVLADVDRPDFREALGSALQATGAADAAAAARAAAAHGLPRLGRPRRGALPPPPGRVSTSTSTPRPRWPGPGRTSRSVATGRRCRCWPGACTARAARDDALAVLDEAFALGAADPLLRTRAREIREGST